MKVIILGAGGYLGKVMYKKCKANKMLTVKGTYYSKPFEDTEYLDILDTKSSTELLESFCPDVIVWCICSKDNEPQIAYVGLSSILSAIKPTTKFIYISSTLSSKENQDENTLPEQRSADLYLSSYVNGKILGEQLTQNHLNHVIIRPGQIFGFGVNGEFDVRMQRIKDELENNNQMIRTVNSSISIIHIDDLVNSITELFMNKYTGILCLASENPVSHFEFYRLLARVMGMNENLIAPITSENPYKDYFNVSKSKALLKTVIRNFV